MTPRQTLLQAWDGYFVLRRARPEPLWARLVLGLGVAAAMGAALSLVSVFLMAVPDPGWWSTALANNLLLGTSTACTMLLAWRLIELAAPAPLLEHLEALHDWRSISVYSLVMLLGMAAGVRVAYVLLGEVYNFNMWKKLSGIPMVQLKFLIFAALLVAGNWLWWLVRAKERALAHYALESQLRMLQAQIEPHFLFNTLANVQSLIASDGPRAQLMLESFTDYLRASLGQMRSGDSTLDIELDTARSYLELMQVRMGSRLAFSLDACAIARTAALPPLLLQPLVENAVQHGLEGKIEGGKVAVSAIIIGEQLEITVVDDGLGQAARTRPRRHGNGVALQNIGARLLALYGRQASLSLEDLMPGTRARLVLPFRPGSLPHFSS